MAAGSRRAWRSEPSMLGICFQEGQHLGAAGPFEGGSKIYAGMVDRS